MKSVLKVLGIIVLVFVVVVAGAVAYLLLKKPAQRPASAERIEATAERVARGKYLVHNVSICLDCHSERTNAYALPFVPGSEGARGFVWNREIGFPGVLPALNLTPDRETGLGAWTDGEILRAMREGVNREGKPMFPIMPYLHYRHMSDDDARAVVAYLRTLKPIRYEEPVKSLDVPLNIVEKFAPVPLEGPVTAPPRSDHLAYGEYLVKIAACSECHTPKNDKGEPLPDMAFAGGFEMHTPKFRVVTANITPHPTNWMGTATKEQFIGRFRAFANFTIETAPQAPQGKNTLMPWIAYAGMTDDDLGAIYDYLKTVKPIENRVDPFPDAE